MQPMPPCPADPTRTPQGHQLPRKQNPVTQSGGLPNGSTVATIIQAPMGHDTVMEDASEEEEVAISGGQALLCHHLRLALVKIIQSLIENFICQVVVVETLKRVPKENKSTEVTDKTKRIAEVLAKEILVTPKVLGGLIEEKNTRIFQSIETNK